MQMAYVVASSDSKALCLIYEDLGGNLGGYKSAKFSETVKYFVNGPRMHFFFVSEKLYIVFTTRK